MITPLDCFLLVGALFCIYRLLKPSNRIVDYPPGPQGYPVIGNVLDMPKPNERAWEKYAQWAINTVALQVSVNVLGQRMVIVNDPDIAMEMLDKKGAIYSGRPRVPMNEMCHIDRRIVAFQNNKMLKETRKLAGRILGSLQALEKFVPYVEHQSTMLLKRVMDSPEDYKQAVEKTTGALILEFAYGYKVQETGNDPQVNAAGIIVYKIGEISKPGRFMVNLFPSLRHIPAWFPLARNFQEFAAEGRRLMHVIMDDTMDFVQQNMEQGTSRPSLVSELLNEFEDDDSPGYLERFTQIQSTAGTLYTRLAWRRPDAASLVISLPCLFGLRSSRSFKERLTAS